MENRIISNWIRQARYRAKANDLPSDLEMDDVHKIITLYDNKCAYCTAPAETLDHPFPMRDNAPNVAANVLPICKSCKRTKKSHDIVWMYNNRLMTEELYLCVMRSLVQQRGGEIIKEHIRRATGILDE